MSMILTIAGSVALLIGAVFCLVGAVGLLKLNTSMNRLHAPTKVGTMGVGSLLAASMLFGFANGEGSLHEVLIMAFLFVTAPISANFLAKVAIFERACVTPPKPDVDADWATVPKSEDPAHS